MASVTVGQDDGQVYLVQDGKVVLAVPWEAAREIARTLFTKAGEAEEQARANQIAYEQAILLRKGVPFGLTTNPAIQQEAASLAQYDDNLRRYLPGGVRAQSIVGTPTIITTTVVGSAPGDTTKEDPRAGEPESR